MHRLVVTLTAVALTLAGCTATTSGAAPVTNEKGYVPGDGRTIIYPQADRKAAPAIAESTLDGGRFDLGAQHGQVVVVNFWASWCAPCRAEAADLEAAHQATKVPFVGIDSRDQKDAANAFVAGRVTYPSLFDPAGRIALRFSDVPPNTFPATLIVDRNGRVAVVIRTRVTKDSLVTLLRQIGTET